jgi:PAS domain S-box-containing protein
MIAKVEDIQTLYVNLEDRAKVRHLLETEGMVTRFETEIYRKDGDKILVSLNIKAVKDSTGKILYFDGTTENIAARKRTEAALRENEEKYRLLIENSPDIVYMLSPRGVFTFVSPSWTMFLGHTVNQVTSQSFKRFVHPDDVGKCEAFMRKVLETGQRQSGVEYRLRHADGSWLWHISSGAPVRNDAGKIVGYEGIASDITGHKKMEEALIESERRLTDIINFLPDATFAINLDGKIISWNRAMEEMTGVKAKDMLGKSDYEYAIPFYGQRRPLLIDLILKRNKKIEQSYDSVIKKEGRLLISEIWVPCLKEKRVRLWGKASPLYDGKGNILGAIESIRDITARKQAQEAVKKREAELKLKAHELEDLNAALSVLLKKRENDKNELEDKITSNIKMLVLPQIEKIKEKLTGRKAMMHIDLLEANLKEIVSPFAQKLSANYLNLTNKEIYIANLIKEGNATKEIAEILSISESTVNIHRYNIRKKLNLTKKHNLRAYLSSLA